MWPNNLVISEYQICTPLEIVGGLAAREWRGNLSAVPLDLYELCELFRLRGKLEERRALKDIDEILSTFRKISQEASEKPSVKLKNEQYMLQYCQLDVSPELQKIQFFYGDSLRIGLYPLDFLRNYKAKWMVIRKIEMIR